jgi:hypothetical protein
MKRSFAGIMLGLSILAFWGCSNPSSDSNDSPTAVAFSGLTANGTSGSVTTTALSLSFSVDPTTLAASDITVTGATKGALTGTGTTRSLAISAITVADGASVTVALASPSGFAITPASKSVAVYVSAVLPTAVSFTGLTANGTSGSVTTTALTLSFSVDPTTLAASDVTVTGATKGALTGTGTTRSLAISAITASDENVTVSLANPAGYSITPASKVAAVNVAGIYRIGDIGPSGVGTVFYVSNGGAKGLEAAPISWSTISTDCQIAWISGGSTETTLNDGTTTTIGSGLANSNAIVAQSGEVMSAAIECRAYHGGGKTDWFLPSKDELNQMFVNKSVLGVFVSDFYWSSSEYDATRVWVQLPTTLYSGQANKGTGFFTRAIRSF